MNSIHGIPMIPKLCILAELETVIYFSSKIEDRVNVTKRMKNSVHCIMVEKAHEVLSSWHDYKKNRNFVSSLFAKLFRMDVEYDDKAETIKDWLRTL